MPVTVYNRSTKATYTEQGYGEKQLTFLYDTYVGRLLLLLVVARPWYSRINAIYNRTKYSAKKIKPLVLNNSVALSDAEITQYHSFNDFFTRPLPAPSKTYTPTDVISVAEAKLMVYPITKDGEIPIKKSIYTISELIGNSDLAAKYADGVCLVFRLSIDNNHRYTYVDSGTLVQSYVIKGSLHTVQALSERRHKVYCENYRVCSELATENFKTVAVIEIGALLVGKINNYKTDTFVKGQEKGYFELGGSTIVLLFTKDTISIDDDILEFSGQNIETAIQNNDKIGAKRA